MIPKSLSTSQLWPILGIVSLGALLYANILNGEFQFDDHPVIVHNEVIRAANPLVLWQTVQHPTRYVAYLTFWVNYQLGGLNPLGYHLVNVIIHLINALLLYALVRLLLRTPCLGKGKGATSPILFAATVAVLFVCHPLHTQSVSYITQRFTSLATLFYLLCLCFYLKGRMTGHKGGRAVLFVGALISAVLGMFTKQITLTLPLMVILMEFACFPKRARLGLIGLLLVVLVLSALIPGLYQFNASGILSITHENGNHPGDIVTASSYARTQPAVVISYLRLLLLPWGQTLLHDFPLSTAWTSPATLFSIMGLFFLFGIAIVSWHRARLLSLGILWFFLTLAVEASVIPIRHVFFEHRTYLPSIGFFLVATWILQQGKVARRARTVVVLSIVVVLSLLTVQRNSVWQTGVALWTDVAQKTPHSARAFYNLGYEYLKDGLAAPALENFNKALLIDPDYELAYINRSQLLLDQGNIDLALHDINNAIRLNDRRAETYLNRGVILRQQGRFRAALRDFRQARTLDPDNRPASINTALTLGNLGRFDSGLKVIDSSMQQHGANAKALSVRGALQMAKRDIAGAIESFSQAITLNPDDTELYGNRAQAWQVLGRYDRALEDLTALIEHEPSEAEHYTQRAYVLTRLNRLPEALADYARVARQKPGLAQVYLERGKIFYKQGDYRQAATEFDLYLRRTPRAADAFMLRGLSHYELREFKQALADFQSARDLGYRVDDAYFRQLNRLMGNI